MPYIRKEKRVPLATGFISPEGPGELNYAITQLILDYLAGRQSYDLCNEVIGVLECAKLELYRRMVAPYENKKCAENGDVYPE